MLGRLISPTPMGKWALCLGTEDSIWLLICIWDSIKISWYSASSNLSRPRLMTVENTFHVTTEVLEGILVLRCIYTILGTKLVSIGRVSQVFKDSLWLAWEEEEKAKTGKLIKKTPIIANKITKALPLISKKHITPFTSSTIFNTYYTS